MRKQRFDFQLVNDEGFALRDALLVGERKFEKEFLWQIAAVGNEFGNVFST